MGDVKWIKITTTIFDDEKIRFIENMKDGNEILLIWFKLLCLAGKSNSSGALMFTETIPYQKELISSLFHTNVKNIQRALNVFKELNMIEVSDKGVIWICNWEKHQNIEGIEKIREQTKKRVQRYRDKAMANKSDSNVSCNVTSNATCNGEVTHCNAIDKELELEEDKEKEKYKRKRSDNSAPSSSDEASEPAVFEMPLNDNTYHPITQSEVDEWQSLYPAVDVMQELRKMKGWCQANPKNRKTKSGVKRFINGWLAREQDRGKKSYVPVQKGAMLPKYYQKSQEEKIDETPSEEELAELEAKLKTRG